MEAESLSVEFQLQRASGELLHRETKTEASEDDLPLPDVCAVALEQRRQVQERDKRLAGAAWQPSELAFTTSLGTPVDPRNFNRAWDARALKARVPKITVHDGRRTCGTLLVDLDVHPRQIMRILRHAQFSVTMEIYAQASSRKTREALKRLGDSLGE